MKPKFLFLSLLGLALFTSPGWAHHGGGGSGSTTLTQTFSERINVPRSYLLFNFSMDFLDEDLGEVLLYQLQGEYAVNNRFSLGGRIPLWSVYQNFLASNTHLGDMALLLKGVLLNSKEQGINLLAGLDISFPTGNDEESRGAGAIVMAPYLTFSKDFNVLQLFSTLSTSFELADEVNPTLGYELGLIFPLLKGKVPLQLLLAFQGSTFLDSDTFEGSSIKAFLAGGFLVQMAKNWEASVIGKVSVVDSLDFKPNLAFSDFSTGLLTDVLAGFSFTVGYRF